MMRRLLSNTNLLAVMLNSCTGIEKISVLVTCSVVFVVVA